MAAPDPPSPSQTERRRLDLANRLALSTAEAARALGVSERHLRSIRHELPTVHFGGRVLFPVDALREHLSKRATCGESAIDASVREIMRDISGENDAA